MSTSYKQPFIKKSASIFLKVACFCTQNMYEAVLQVQPHLVLLQIHCNKVQYSRYIYSYLVNKGAFIPPKSTSNGKTEVRPYLQEGMQLHCLQILRMSPLLFVCKLNPSMMLISGFYFEPLRGWFHKSF